MKKIISSFILTILLIGSIFSLSGCYKYPKSIIIDEIEYVNGFYDGLYLVGIEYKEFSTSLFVEGNHHWWHLEDSTFDMYYCRHKDSLNWFPTLYCKKSQLEEIKNYYHNTDNFDYYLGYHLEDEKDVKLGEEIDRSMIEKAVSMIVDVDNYSTKKYKKTTLQLDGITYIRPTIYRKSKDGLFTTTHKEWIYYEENLYVFDYTIGSNNKYYVFILDEDVHTYMINLLKEYGIV